MLRFETTVHPAFVVGRTDPRLFGSFVEHMGSVVYHGIFQPGHPSADAHGWRTDVMELLKGLHLSVVRYPGGNYTSAYRWEDTVGKNRKPTLNLPWREMETHEFGLHEFFAWLSELGAQPMLTVNLGTRGAMEAADLLEYCNMESGTKFSDMRRENGADKPFSVKMWCLGNELDGSWQIGHKRAKEYGRLAEITGQYMRRFDPDLELACVGSSSTQMENYPEWNRKVLMQCFDQVDFITLHRYLSKKGLNTAAYLSSPADMDRMIETVTRACDYVAACYRSKKKIRISFDEWNVGPVEADGDLGIWPVGPMRDCISFTFEDALVFAGMMLSLLRHADRVAIACQALLVNDLGMVLCDGRGAWPNSTYPVFQLLSEYGRGTVLETRGTGDMLDTEAYGSQPALDVYAVRSEEEVRFFAVNRMPEKVRWTIHTSGFSEFNGEIQAMEIHAPLEVRNSLEKQDAVRVMSAEVPMRHGETLEGEVKPYSLTLWRIGKKTKEKAGKEEQ